MCEGTRGDCMKRLLCILLLIVIICCSACQKNEPIDHSSSVNVTATGESNITNQTEEIKDLSDEELAKKVAEKLGVPDKDGITYEIGDKFLWTAAQRYVRNVTFYENGNIVAGASVDPSNGELLMGIYKYTKPNDTPNDQSLSPSFFDAIDAQMTDSRALTEEELKPVLSLVPDDRYEEYPDTHGVPLSATLYKDGQTISIDVNDPRLVKLTNLFNNCVYYSRCSYLQGFYSLDDLEKKIAKEDFRLELKYTPYGDTRPGPYGTSTSMCDTITVLNTRSSFLLIAHDLPGNSAVEDEYPFLITSFAPLGGMVNNILDLFGF